MAKKRTLEIDIKGGKKVKATAKDMDKLGKSMDGIDKKTTRANKSANTAKRAQEGVAKAGLSTGKAFSRQAQGLGGIVRVYATIAANVFAISSAFRILKDAADLSILSRGVESFANSTGANLDSLAKKIQDTTAGLLDIQKATELGSLGISGGASQEQLVQLTEIATKAAQALGRNVPEAVNRLTQAVIKGEPELADEFGIIN